MDLVLLCLALAALTAAGAFARAQAAGYKVVNKYVIPEEGLWDFVTIDSNARRLYMAGNREKGLVVIDLDSGRVTGHIPQLRWVKGIAIAEALHRGFASDAENVAAVIFDTRTLQVIKSVPLQRTQRHPDFMLYDAFSGRVFPLMDRVTVIEAKTGDIAGTINLGSAPETAVSDGKGTIYVNMLDAGEVAVIDAITLAIKKRYATPNCSPQTLSYDAAQARLLIGCGEFTAHFMALDAKSGKIEGRAAMCSGADQGAYDPVRKLIFEACDEGVVSIIGQLKSGDGQGDYYHLIQTVPTAISGHDMGYDARTGRLFIPVVLPDRPAKHGYSNPFEILVVGSE